jgi:hypothetical protein
MNCANHPGVENVAYCRTCGKALCNDCTRDVRGVIYCENCLAQRLGIEAPPAPGPTPPPPPGAPGIVPPQPIMPMGSGGLNPALAGILAGFFPFGVGAVYTGQYAKALAHLMIFVGLIWGLSSGHMGGLEPVLGIGLAFFIVYQIVDSIRTARALQLGQPVPDPFGLGQTFSPGEKIDTSKIPMAAVVLIGLGVLFLLQTSIGFEMDRIWPLFLIGLGVWLFAKRQGMIGSGLDRAGRPYRRGSLTGPAVLVTVGLLSFIDNVGGPEWHRTWPLLLLVIGLSKLMEGRIPAMTGAPPTVGGPSGNPPASAPPADVPPSSEVRNG